MPPFSKPWESESLIRHQLGASGTQARARLSTPSTLSRGCAIARHALRGGRDTMLDVSGWPSPEPNSPGIQLGPCFWTQCGRTALLRGGDVDPIYQQATSDPIAIRPSPRRCRISPRKQT